MKLLAPLLLALAALLIAGGAQAAKITIDPAGCGSCQGLTLSLEANQVGNDVQIILGYSAPAGWTNSGNEGLVKAGFKAAEMWDAGDITLVSIEVDGSPYANIGDWSQPTEASTNSGSSCANGTNSDKGCIYAITSTGTIDLSGGGTAVFEFLIADATLMPDTLTWHIGGTLCDPSANPQSCNGKNISESSPVPEPSAALIFGVGLAVVSGTLRRRS